MRSLLRLCLLFPLLAIWPAVAAESETPRLVLPTPHGEPITQLVTMPEGRFAVTGTQSGPYAPRSPYSLTWCMTYGATECSSRSGSAPKIQW